MRTQEQALESEALAVSPSRLLAFTFAFAAFLVLISAALLVSLRSDASIASTTVSRASR